MNEVNIFDSNGKKQDEAIGLDLKNVSQKDISLKTYSCAVRVLAQNWRQGTVACKARGDVAFANHKPWRQKGTGRARAGSARSPLWRKGGVTFGPQKRVRKLAVNRAQRKIALNNLLFLMLQNKMIHCLDFKLVGARPKTKDVARVLKQMELYDKKGIIFLPHGDDLMVAAFRNISSVNVFHFDQPNAFDLSNGQYWLFLKKDINSFKDMVARWS